MIDVHFEQPQWAHLVWLILGFTVLLLALEHRCSHHLTRLLSSVMQDRLVARPARWRRAARAIFIGASCVCMVIALMRPQWGFEYIESPRVGAQIMICLDVSRSMLAEDVAPNRLERAKAEINDLLGLLDKDHVGLIAFAGKATVLSPMTPDFGFLRMVLEYASPNSVAKGGTNLETPIRKALDGYRGQSEASRAIILITDGEDHDSFVMDAAKEAADRGIRIITIGFGDEAGSAIHITDPKTQARTTLRDANGTTVMSRLDGETLREISQTTQSVYIPAGTGVLDLKSIYDAHIAPLTRGQLESGGRTIKKEGYQWAILAGLAFLIAALTVAGGRSRVGSSSPSLAAAMVLLFVTIANADNPDLTPGTPRQIYNQGAAHLNAGQLDDAEQQLTEARNNSGIDNQMRYQATFNLGWIQIKRADQLLEEKPQEALTHLHAAADWFRDAVELQPDNKVPRENLEIVIRRALVLADSLTDKDDRKLAARLDELIVKQREVASVLQGAVERAADNDLAAFEAMRNEFRAHEVQQRHVLSTLDEVAAMSRQESEQLQGIEEDKRTPQQKMRQMQLAAVQVYMQQAQQRLGQTRRELRRRQAHRAYRRAATGLGELKRARDQLRNLVEMLGAVIGDADSLARQTAGFATHAESITKETSLPSWLTREYLEDTLGQVTARTSELKARVQAGLAGGKQQKEQTPETQKMLATLGKAAPLFKAADASFTQAAEALTSQRDTDSLQAQARAIKALTKARELFLDIKGLIEVMYGDQKIMQQLITDHSMSIDDYLPMIDQKQSGNIVRARRLDELIQQQLQALPPLENKADAAKPTDEQVQQRMQLTLANELLKQVRSSLVDVVTQIDDWNESSDTLSFKGNVDKTIEQLEALRRLFYSIIEHLKETARRQIELADNTRDTATLAEADKIAQVVAH